MSECPRCPWCGMEGEPTKDTSWAMAVCGSAWDKATGRRIVRTFQCEIAEWKGKANVANNRVSLLEAALAVDLTEWVDFGKFGAHVATTDAATGPYAAYWMEPGDFLPLAYAIALYEAAGCPENAEDY